MKKVLFVCTGNTCRSPMAEWIFRILAKEKNLDGWEALSAGTSAFDGDEVSVNSVNVILNEWNTDISSHRSRKLRDMLVDEVSLILTMTKSHKRNILALYPEAEAKIYTLNEFTDSKNEMSVSWDISDPYGMPYEEYHRVAMEIKEAIEKIIEKMLSEEA